MPPEQHCLHARMRLPLTVLARPAATSGGQRLRPRHDPVSGVPLMYDEQGRATRLLEVDAAAAARHDPDVAAGLASLYQERHERIRDAMWNVRDPDTAAWLVAALTAGIGMKESTGLPLPDPDRLHVALFAALAGLT